MKIIHKSDVNRGELAALGVHELAPRAPAYLPDENLNAEAILADAYAIEHDPSYHGPLHVINPRTLGVVATEFPLGAPEHVRRNRMSNMAAFLGYTPEEEAMASALIHQLQVRTPEETLSKPIDEIITL